MVSPHHPNTARKCEHIETSTQAKHSATSFSVPWLRVTVHGSTSSWGSEVTTLGTLASPPEDAPSPALWMREQINSLRCSWKLSLKASSNKFPFSKFIHISLLSLKKRNDKTSASKKWQRTFNKSCRKNPRSCWNYPFFPQVHSGHLGSWQLLRTGKTSWEVYVTAAGSRAQNT